MARYKTFAKTTYNYAGLEIKVLRKNVKNLNLRVYPSQKEVTVSVPKYASDKTIEDFIQRKLPWIKKHLNRPVLNDRQTRLNFTDGEIHNIWGEARRLRILYKKAAPKVEISGNELLLQVRPGSGQKKKAQVLDEWYRSELKREIPRLIHKWEEPMGVIVHDFGVKKMKTRWGTCNIRAHRIWLNLELAKKRPKLLEYVVVHEMVHLLERLHNDRFYNYMTQFFPQWRELKNELNGHSVIRDC